MVHRGKSGVEFALEQAVDRLLHSRPKDARLRVAAARGKLKINITTVAKEAGKSRTLIGYDNCAYPEVRRRVQDLTGKAERGTRQSSLVACLRREVAELREKLFFQQFQMKENLNARLTAETDRDQYRAAYQRLRDSASSKGQVVSLVRKPNTGQD